MARSFFLPLSTCSFATAADTLPLGVTHDFGKSAETAVVADGENSRRDPATTGTQS